MKQALTMIGMPGSGKSTIGKLVAELMGWEFIDLDILILEKTGESHDVILARDGKARLLELENDLALKVNLDDTVFSPGGSIIYSAGAMARLQKETLTVFLDVPLQELQRRLGDNVGNGRGIVDFEEKGLEWLFIERVPILRSYAERTIIGAGRTEAEIVDIVLGHLK